MGELIEISKPAQSQEDLKKFEELKRMKTQKKNEKKKKDKPQEDALPELKMPALPPVQMKRQGGFDIPDFLMN